MSADPNRVRDVFLAAAELAEGERGAFVNRECGSDAELQAEVERLLAGHIKPASILQPMVQAKISTADVRPAKKSPPPQPSAGAGTVISGRYTLLEEIGEGGMGTVWMARQTEPVRRKVAIKLIKPGMDSKAVLARFEAERQALALMDHPNIARVLDGGVTADGRPYFVMDLVKGVPITQYCDAQRLTPRERLELFLPVCHAIQHAHQKGIIHRDVKPSNVLVALYDDRPVPKVIDFGVAKAMGQPLTEQSFHTGFGTVIGTPQYMSPEQATFNNLDVDTRSDLYSLGVLLYELLVGTPPFSKRDLEKAGMLEMLRFVREVEPPRPSTKLSKAKTLPTLAAKRSTEPKKLTLLLRNELDWVVMKALEKDRTRRYDTANGFAADIQRYLSGEPVQAVPPSLGYRVRTYVRKNRGPVIAASLLLLTLLAGIVGTTVGLLRAETKAQDAKKAQDIAEAKEIEANRQKANALEQRARAEKARNRTRDALDAMTSTITGDSLNAQNEISAEQKKFLTEVLEYYKEFAGETADDESSRTQTALAAQRVAAIEFPLGRITEAAAAARQSRDLYAKLVADFPGNPQYRRQLAKTESSLGFCQNREGNLSGALAQARAAQSIQEKLVADYPDVPKYRQDLARSHTFLGLSCRILDRPPHEFEAHYREALTLLEKLVADSPTVSENRADLVACLNDLGWALIMGRENPEDERSEAYKKEAAHKNLEAEQVLRKAVAAGEKLVADFPDVPSHRNTLARTYLSLGQVLQAMRKLPDAEKELRKAHDLLRRLVGDFPSVPAYRSNLAYVTSGIGWGFVKQGKPLEAEVALQESRVILEKQVAEYPVNYDSRRILCIVYERLGHLTGRDKGRVQEAEGYLFKALAMAIKLYEDSPIPENRSNVVESYKSFIFLYAEQHRNTPDEPAQHRKGLVLIEKLVAEFPAVPEFRYESAHGTQVLGHCLFLLKRYPEAEKTLRRAVEMSAKLAGEFPNEPRYRQLLAECRAELGGTLWTLGNHTGGAEELEKAMALFEKLHATHWNDERFRELWPWMHLMMATLRKEQGKKSEAMELHRKAMSLWEAMIAEFPSKAEYRLYFLDNQTAVIALLSEMGKLREAEEEYRRGLAMFEQYGPANAKVPQIQVDLGIAYGKFAEFLRQNNRSTESLEWVEKAIRIQTGEYEKDATLAGLKEALAGSYRTRAIAHDALKRHAEAVKDWSKAFELMPLKGTRISRASSSAHAGQVESAVAEVKELSRLDGWSGNDLFRLARVCSIASAKSTDKKQEYAGLAMEFLSKAVRSGFNNVDALKSHVELDPLRSREDFKALVESLPKKK